MMKMRLVVFILGLVILQSVNAKFEGNSYKEYLYKKYPGYKEQVEREKALSLTAARSGYDERRSSTIWTIPTVFHIIYNTAIQNVSDAVVLSQLSTMNIDFRKVNADVANVVPRFANLPADALIQFDFAKTNPQGGATNGITRTRTSTVTFPAPGDNDFEDACKYAAEGGVDAWDTTKYMNIWVCNLGSGILGYATMGPLAEDGVVITTKYFGTNPAYNQNPYNLGRTATHEVGHWLNLDHTWGPRGDNANCLLDDDVADTPKTSGPSYECNLTAYSCNTFTLVQNYMDYPPDACMVMFTAGQVARMRGEMPDGNNRRKMAYVSTTAVPGLTQAQSLNAAGSLLASPFLMLMMIAVFVIQSLFF